MSNVEVTTATCECGQLVYDLMVRDGTAVKVADHPLSNPYEFEAIDLVCPHGFPWYAIPTGEQVAIWRRDGVA